MPGRLLRILAIPALIGCCAPLTLGARPQAFDFGSGADAMPPDTSWFPEPFPPSGDVWEIVTPTPFPSMPEWFRSHTDLPDEPEHTDLPDEPEANILLFGEFHTPKPATFWEENTAGILAELLAPTQFLPPAFPQDWPPTGNSVDRPSASPVSPTSSNAIPAPGGAVLLGLMGAFAARPRRR